MVRGSHPQGVLRGSVGAIVDELRILAGLTAMTLVVIGIFVYFGRKLSKAAERHAAEINFPFYITRSGTVFFACVAAFMVYCAATRQLAPASSFGHFLNTLDGVASVFTGLVATVVAAGLILEKLGYPIWQWEKDS